MPNREKDEAVPVSLDQEATGGFRSQVSSRLAVLESKQDEHSRSLDKGAETFSQMRKDLDDAKPKPASKLAIASLVVLVAVPLAGTFGMAIWNASRYPERSEFEAVKAQFEGRANELAQSLHDSQRDVVDLRKSLERVELSQEQTNKKLDELLLRVAK